MKRVQALVTGKKKQCTKLPTPSPKVKKSPTAASSPVISEHQAGRGGSNGGSVPTSPTSPSGGSISSAGSTLTASSSNLSNSSNASSVRGVSKIPASSPKKGSKDGGSVGTGLKLRGKEDVDEKNKAKKVVNKKSSKKEVKVDTKVPTRDRVVISARRSSGTAEPASSSGPSSEPRPSLEKVQFDPTLEDVTSKGKECTASDQLVNKTDQISVTSPSLESDKNVTTASLSSIMTDTSQQPLNVQQKPQAELSQQSEGQQTVNPAPKKPPQGILKDTGGSRRMLGNAVSNETYGLLSGTAYDLQHPSRGGSSLGSMDAVYHQSHGSLPRSSRSTTPTPDNIYSYGSLQRRHNAGTPTQANGQYYGQGWGSMSRKADSDYHVDNVDRNYAVISYGHPAGTPGNKTYSALSYPANRPGSVPPPGAEHDPLYSGGVPRPGSVPPHYYGDADPSIYYRGTRGGSVPIGYDSESSAYGSLGSTASRPRHYDSDSGYKNGSPGMKVHPDDQQYRAGPGKRPIPRRHTVGVSGGGPNGQETERKREAFMQLLAQRYPQYAEKIQGTGGCPSPQPMERPARSREIQRRRTAVVTYDPHHAGQTLEYEDQGTMSDLELPSFQRGGFTRTSLPIVRSASTSLERPLGLVFLVYGDQTKKSLLPNEITTLDTVRALFVRAFPDLTLEMLENPRKKIYLLDPATNIYFQLEDLGDIKDRSVLKIHDTDSLEPQKVKEHQEVRGRTVQMPVSRSQSRGPYNDVPVNGPDVAKCHSLPPQVSHNYQDMMQEQRNQWEIERRSRSRTPEPADRPRSLSAGASSRQKSGYSHSPDRLPTPDRLPLNPIPENRQLPPGYHDPANYYEPVGPGAFRAGAYSSQIYDVPAPYQGYPPTSPVPGQPTYIARSTRATPLALAQRAIGPTSDSRADPSKTGGRHTVPYAPSSQNGNYQRSQSFRLPPSERDGKDVARPHSVTPGDDTTRNRIEKMEQQLASLTAWVHYQKTDGIQRPVQRPSSSSSVSDSSDTFPESSASKHKGDKAPISTLTPTNHVVKQQGLSDIPNGCQGSSGISSRESTPLSAQAEVTAKLAQLKSDLHVLRRQQQLNMEAMRDELGAAFIKIKKVLSTVPGAENQVNFHKRNEATMARNFYEQDKTRVQKELSDLEASVEELRADVISRQCRVNSVDVEGLALLLSNVTKSLAELKARFPEILTQLKSVMDAEMRQVVSEEKFLKEEPVEIENCLKRCKKLTNTLYTLKRLASVQDHRPSQVPQIPSSSRTVDNDQKNALLENIRSLVPDHDQRLNQIEAAEAARERKKKISTQQEALKFGKTLELASKNLKPPSATIDRVQDGGQPEVKEEQLVVTRPAIAAKPVIAQVTSSVAVSLPYTTIALVSNVFSVKPSFSTAPSSLKPLDKPTATVSAMTSSVSDSITTTAAKQTTEMSSVPPVTKTASLPLTETTSRLSGVITSDSVKINTDKQVDPSIYTYQVCGPVNPVIPFPPVFKHGETSTETTEGSSSVDKTQSATKPSGLPLPKSESKKLSVSFSESSPTFISNDHLNSHKNTNGNDAAKDEHGSDKPTDQTNTHIYSDQKPVDLASQKHAARSAFFSSLNTPPTSPSMSSSQRDSVSLDAGPVVTPTGVVGKVTAGPTINLVLTGSASPKSPTSPGTFTISPPREILYPPVEMRKPLSQASPTRGIPRAQSEVTSSGSDTSESSLTDGNRKKVPPPPPPRKGSRPTSASSVSPVSSSAPAQDLPRFVGGILGQHRLSGGPLASTPKPGISQKPLSRFEKDIATGLYANLNRPDLQSQSIPAQQLISQANSQKPDNDNNNTYDSSIPPPPSVTIPPLDREERGSSSDSTSSSSSTSMGSQQSVISVIRSASVNVRSIPKPKPDPPRRQSSLLSKFTGDKDEPLNNGSANMNGVDL